MELALAHPYPYEDSVAREFLNLSTERYGLVKTTF